MHKTFFTHNGLESKIRIWRNAKLLQYSSKRKVKSLQQNQLSFLKCPNTIRSFSSIEARDKRKKRCKSCELEDTGYHALRDPRSICLFSLDSFFVFQELKIIQANFYSTFKYKFPCTKPQPYDLFSIFSSGP